MIRIDALHFLLLVELLFALAAIAGALAFRGKKLKALHQGSVQELAQAREAQEQLQKQLAEAGTKMQQPSEAADPAAAPAIPAGDANMHEKCKVELSVVEAKLKEKTTLLNDLQAKFDDLEKEYLILYRQQQKQEQDAEKTKS